MCLQWSADVGVQTESGTHGHRACRATANWAQQYLDGHRLAGLCMLPVLDFSVRALQVVDIRVIKLRIDVSWHEGAERGCGICSRSACQQAAGAAGGGSGRGSPAPASFLGPPPDLLASPIVRPSKYLPTRFCRCPLDVLPPPGIFYSRQRSGVNVITLGGVPQRPTGRAGRFASKPSRRLPLGL